MAYRKHIWRNGEVIKADLLQNMENGIANEEQRAISAEAVLDGKIEANKSLANTAISNETSRAITEENALAVGIENCNDNIESLQQIVDAGLSSVYKPSGSVYFADLPALAEIRMGNVYNIIDAFTTTASFLEGAGKSYPAGSNVAIIQKELETYNEATVESSDNPSDMGLYELDGTTYVLTEDTEPVTGKTYYELTATAVYYYDVLSGFVDTTNFVTKTDYATPQVAGIVKPDGTTIEVNNGMISSVGGDYSDVISDILNILGAKNLIPINYDAGSLGHAIIETNADGSLTIRGEISQGDDSILLSTNVLHKGTYVLTTGQPDESNAEISISAVINNVEVASSKRVQGGDNTFTVAQDTTVVFGLDGEEGFDGEVTIYPMCRPASIDDNTYVPFSKTNRQLTANVGKDLTPQTLAIGSTTLTFYDSSITANSTIFPYTSKWGVTPLNITTTTGQAVLTFAAQAEAISVYINVK